MIDASIQLLWQDTDAEFIHCGGRDGYGETADSAQARRLQVLFAESAAAGVPSRPFAAIVLAWAESCEPQLRNDTNHCALDNEIEALRVVLAGQLPVTESCGVAPAGDRTEAWDLACSVNHLTDWLASGLEWRDSEEAALATWWWAAEMLLPIFKLSGHDAIGRCAEIAHSMLFPHARRWRAS